MIGSLAKGSSRSFPFAITLADGTTPSAAFLPSDTLACAMWKGDDQAAVASPAVAWTACPAYAITFAPADTSGLADVGTYRVRVTVARGADTVEVLRDTIEVLPVPGSGGAYQVYCSFEDMSRECPWVGQFLDRDADQTGFLEQRAEAREWLDGLILAAYPGARVAYLQDGWPSNYGQFSLIANPWLKAQLDAGAVVQSGARGRHLARVAACYALALVFRAQAGPSDQLGKFAGYFMRRAHAEAANLTVELDINADGVSDLAIPLSLTNTRRG